VPAAEKTAASHSSRGHATTVRPFWGLGFCGFLFVWGVNCNVVVVVVVVL